MPHARHVLDRFHIHTLVQRRTRLRCAETSVAANPAAPDPHTTAVFKARFLLLRRGDELKDADHARLDKLFAEHPRLKAGWQALHELHGMHLADDEAGALQALGRFCDLYATGELPEFHSIADTIIASSDEILAPHQPRVQRPHRPHQQPAPESYDAPPTASPTLPTSQPEEP